MKDISNAVSKLNANDIKKLEQTGNIELAINEKSIIFEISDFEIVSKGDNYKVGDSLNFDNTNTDGGGASALISKVQGKDIGNLTVGVTTFRDVVFVRGGNGTVSGFISTKPPETKKDLIRVLSSLYPITLPGLREDITLLCPGKIPRSPSLPGTIIVPTSSLKTRFSGETKSKEIVAIMQLQLLIF